MISAAYYPSVVVLLLLGLTTLYHLAPPRRLPWRRGVPGAVMAMLIFLAGSAALRAYISFILDHNHAYGTLAAPIAALLFFFMLAFGVLTAPSSTPRSSKPSPSRQKHTDKAPRVLDPRAWRHGWRPAAREPLDQPPSQSDSTFS